MAEICRVCGGSGKFVITVSEWAEPKNSPPYYEVKIKQEELVCKCCNGRGGHCGC